MDNNQPINNTFQPSTPPPPAPPANPPTPSVPPVTPLPSTPPQQNIPTPPSGSNGKSGAIIVGGILFVFLIIVIALYALIISQSGQKDDQATPVAPQQVEQPTPTEAPLNEEESEVINVGIEENIDEDFAPIDQDLNRL